MTKVRFTRDGREPLELEFDTARMDDAELVDALAAMNKGKNHLAISDVVDKIFGPDKAALYDWVRMEDGRVPMTEVAELLNDLFEQVSEAKN